MAEAYLHAKFYLDPSNRLATVHERHRQRDRTDRQTTDRYHRANRFTNGRPKIMQEPQQLTNLCRCPVVRISISEDNDNVRHVATVASLRRQHWLTNIGKSSSRVHADNWISIKRQDGWSDWGDRRVGAQIKAWLNACRINDKTHACVTAVNIQPSDKPWQDVFYNNVEVVWNVLMRPVHQENDINRTVRWRSCNNILCTQ